MAYICKWRKKEKWNRDIGNSGKTLDWEQMSLEVGFESVDSRTLKDSQSESRTVCDILFFSAKLMAQYCFGVSNAHRDCCLKHTRMLQLQKHLHQHQTFIQSESEIVDGYHSIRTIAQWQDLQINFNSPCKIFLQNQWMYFFFP